MKRHLENTSKNDCIFHQWVDEDNLPYWVQNINSISSPTMSHSAGQNSSLLERKATSLDILTLQYPIQSCQLRPQVLLVTSAMTKPSITTSQTQIIYNGLTYPSPILQLHFTRNSDSNTQQPVQVLLDNTNNTFAASIQPKAGTSTVQLAPVQLNNYQDFTRFTFPSANRPPLLAPTATNLYNSRNSMKILTLRNESQANLGPIYVSKKPSKFLHLGNQKFYTFKRRSLLNNKNLTTIALTPIKNIVVFPYVPPLTVKDQKSVSLSEQTDVREQTNNGIPKKSDSESEKESSERAAAIKRIVESFEAMEKIIEQKAKARKEAEQKGEVNQDSLSGTSVCSWCADYCLICNNFL